MSATRPFHEALDRRGFTATELVIVLAILAVMSAVALPRIDIARFQVEGAMQDVGTTLVGAQQFAVMRQHDVVVQFDVAGSALRLHYDADNDGTVNAGERVRNVPLGDHIVFGAAGTSPLPMGGGPVTFTRQVGGLPAVVFHRNGSASQAGGIYLTSIRATRSAQYQDDTRAVQLERATGRVAWYRWRDGAWVRGF